MTVRVASGGHQAKQLGVLKTCVDIDNRIPYQLMWPFRVHGTEMATARTRPESES